MINQVIIWRADSDSIRISIIIMIIPFLVIMLIVSALTPLGRLISTGFRLP